MDESSDDKARVDTQRGENLGEERPIGKLRFPWVHTGTPPFPKGGRWYLGAAPSKKSVLRIKRKVSELLTPGNKGAWPEVQARLNRLLGGWSAYFSYGSLATAHQAVDRHVFDRVLAFLRRGHNTPSRGVRRFSREIHGNPGVLVLNRVPMRKRFARQ